MTNKVRQSAGFSTLELMIAFALLTIILTGVVLAQFSANYWQIASETSNEALYKAKTHLEIMRGAAQGEFTLASSSPTQKDMDATCASGGLCYYVTDTVTDLSPCAKYLKSQIDWSVQSYPTTTTSLFTTTTNPAEAILLGGDCPLLSPPGAWTSLSATSTLSEMNYGSGNPTALDVQEGTVYFGKDQAPYLGVYKKYAGFVAFSNGFSVGEPVNAIDVARDQATGRTYAYLAVASTTNQFRIVDLTDVSNPVLSSSVSLPGVTGQEGWRIFLYDRKVYITTREGGGNELHVFDVSNPIVPKEIGSKQLATSVYDMVIRDRKIGGTTYRFAYFATTRDNGEVEVYNVTDPASISELPGARTDLPGDQDSLSLYLSGTKLYAGRDSVPGESDVYVLETKNVLSAAGGLPILTSADLGTGRHAGKIRASGNFVYVQSVNTTNSTGDIEVRKTSDLSLVSHISIAQPVDSALDIDDSYLFTLTKQAPNHVRIFQGI